MLSAAILAARSTVREKKNWQIHLNYVKQVGMHLRKKTQPGYDSVPHHGTQLCAGFRDMPTTN